VCAARMVALLTLSLQLACAHGGRSIAPAEEREARAPISVVVTNHNWNRIDVYAAVAGETVRLGQVETGHTETFVLPSLVQTAPELSLIADLIGADGGYETGSIMIWPGTVIELRIENRLPLSSYTIPPT
jgi:hypothetical protein